MPQSPAPLTTDGAPSEFYNEQPATRISDEQDTATDSSSEDDSVTSEAEAKMSEASSDDQCCFDQNGDPVFKSTLQISKNLVCEGTQKEAYKGAEAMKLLEGQLSVYSEDLELVILTNGQQIEYLISGVSTHASEVAQESTTSNGDSGDGAAGAPPTPERTGSSGSDSSASRAHPQAARKGDADHPKQTPPKKYMENLENYSIEEVVQYRDNIKALLGKHYDMYGKDAFSEANDDDAASSTTSLSCTTRQTRDSAGTTPAAKSQKAVGKQPALTKRAHPQKGKQSGATGSASSPSATRSQNGDSTGTAAAPKPQRPAARKAASTKRTHPKTAKQGNAAGSDSKPTKRKRTIENDNDSEDDMPLAQRMRKV